MFSSVFCLENFYSFFRILLWYSLLSEDVTDIFDLSTWINKYPTYDIELDNSAIPTSITYVPQFPRELNKKLRFYEDHK